MSGDVKAKEPAIRFAGFDEEWEEFSLGEISTDAMYGINSAAAKFDGINKYLRITDIDDESRLFLPDPLTSPGNKVNSKFYLKKNDLVFARTGASVGKSYLYKESDGCLVFAGFLIKFFIKNSNPDFVYQSTLTSRYFRWVEITSMRSGQPGINAEEYKTLPIILPSISEQKKIGDFLKKLDSTINQQRIKLDKLNNLKQSMLQKMFPQGDTVVPEIRFQGFLGDWKKYQLSNISDIIGGGTPSTGVAQYWNGDIDWYSPTEIGSKVYADGSVKKITKEGLENSSAKILPANRTILFTSRAGIGDTAILRHEGCTNQGFQSLVLSDGIDPYFIYSMAYLIKNYALKYASGSTFLEISSKQLGKMSLLLPDEEEQQKIGTYFRKLDELIALHQTQLEKLKQIKLGCLGGMFV